MIPGQSGRRSRSIRRRFVTKSLTSDGGNGFALCVCLAVAFTDKLRERPFVAVPVAEEADVERDMCGL